MGGAIVALLAVVLLVALILFRLIEVTFIRLGRAAQLGLDEASGDESQLADLISDEVLPRASHYLENHQPSWFDRARSEHRSLSWRNPAQRGRSNIRVVSAWGSHT